MQVSLHNIVLIRVKVFQASREKNTPTLSSSLRFRNECFTIRLSLLLALISKLFPEFTEFAWQEPGLWKEFIVLWKQIVHAL